MSGYFSVDTVLLTHPRARAAGKASIAVWLYACLWSTDHGTAGHIPQGQARALGTSAEVERLVRNELWRACREHDGCFETLRWRGETEVEADVRRQREREKKARYRARRKMSTLSGGQVSTPDGGHVHPDSVDIRNSNVHDVPGGHLVDSPLCPPSLDTTSSLVVPPLSPPQGGSDRKRSRPLPDGWTPTDRHREYAGQHRINLEVEAEKFRNHHAMRGTLGKDWDAGFRNWLVRAVEYRDRDAQRGGPARAATAADRFAERPMVRF